MTRLVRDYVDLRACDSFDELLERLAEVRARLPEPASAQVKLRGDDFFGRLITILYFRPQTPEEEAREARYR